MATRMGSIVVSHTVHTEGRRRKTMYTRKKATGILSCQLDTIFTGSFWGLLYDRDHVMIRKSHDDSIVTQGPCCTVQHKGKGKSEDRCLPCTLYVFLQSQPFAPQKRLWPRGNRERDLGQPCASHSASDTTVAVRRNLLST